MEMETRQKEDNGVGCQEEKMVRLASLSDHIHYVPQFVSAQEECELLARVYGVPRPKWRTLARRRLQNWGGTVVGNAEDGKPQCLLQNEQLPDWLERCIDRIMGLDCGDFPTFPSQHRPNHVLVNEYLAGQGIMPHTDGPAFYPLISTISLGSHTLLDLYDEQDRKRTFVGSVLLEPRSLVLIGGRAYQLLHGIAERTIDQIRPRELVNLKNFEQKELVRGKRVSLTIRNVPNKKMNRIFGRIAK